jgi:D-arabinono-1,4-lactone oxidase/FAD binding domain
VTIADSLGSQRYEQIRAVIRRALPLPADKITDVVVDAFVAELQRRGLEGIELLGLPRAESTSAPSYPLYLANAMHRRVHPMDSAQPFHSSFVGHLPTVRVPLPWALNYQNTQLSTAIGTIDFARDHLAGSVELVSRLYSAELGYAAARVDLITPARQEGVRFGAIAVYLGYRAQSDTAPSFYVLEAGLATGQAAMLYLGKTMGSQIVLQGAYEPTPFSAPDNIYTGTLSVVNDQPVRLNVQANAPSLPWYIDVTIDYQQLNAPPDILPLCLTLEAIARVAALGNAMNVPTGMPEIAQELLGELALLFLPWIEKPSAQTVLSSGSAPSDLPVQPNQPPGVIHARGHTLLVPAATRAELHRVLGPAGPSDPRPQLRALLDPIPKTTPGAPNLAVLPNGASVVAIIEALALGSDADGSTTGTGQRQTWANQLANQTAQPLSIYRPTSLNATGDSQSVESILKLALATDEVVKAAGSGHSYSDVATTPDLFIDTHGLGRLADTVSPITGQLSPAVVRSPLPLALAPIAWPSYDPENHRALIEMEAGITIRALNPALEARNLALSNMGGYDGQTIVGAISTSTHGSGVTLGPFPDMVRSLVLATTGRWNGKTVSGHDPDDGVHYYRIEPSDGITDPVKYNDPLIELIQDDECFNAAICSIGCFGVIYSVVLEVMQMYWLSETRTLTSLSQLMQDLAPNPNNPQSLPDVLLNTRNYEVLIQPYPLRECTVVTMDPSVPIAQYDPCFKCLVTRRTIAPKPAVTPTPRKPVPDWLGKLLDIALHAEPGLTPMTLEVSLWTLVDTDYVERSYEVYNLALGGDVGFAAEIGFSLEDSAGNYTPAHFRAAIDTIHRIAQQARVQGTQYQTSPFSLRFVNSSRAQLSMMQGRRTAMIEMDMLTGTYAGNEIMYRYETASYALGGRPHWGLEFDLMSGNNELLSKLYPQLGRWLAVYKQFNALGTFDNRFTQRMGFSVME